MLPLIIAGHSEDYTTCDLSVHKNFKELFYKNLRKLYLLMLAHQKAVVMSALTGGMRCSQ
jgi:hypothetical protein